MTLKHQVYDRIDPTLRAKVEKWLSQEPTHFIDGVRSKSTGSKNISMFDPATDEIISCIADGTQADVDRAIKSSQGAFEQWSKLKPSKRSEVLSAAAVKIRSNIEELALLETLDTGKPMAVASGEIWWASDAFRYYAGLANQIDGRTTGPIPGVLAASLRQPLGVCVAITAWNFPAILMGFKVPPSLAAGNSMIVKPSEQASLSSLRFAVLLVEGGLPAGLVNVITGLGTGVGAALVANPQTRAITFTGSTKVGRIVGREAGERFIPVGLELGGKSPQVIFANTDLDLVAPAVYRGIYQNAGQMCGAGSQIVCDHRITDELISRLTEISKQSIAGHGLDPDSTLGPLISKEHFNRVESYVERARNDGGVIHYGGSRVVTNSGGNFFEPTLISGLDSSHPCVVEEIFGPVAVLQQFDSQKEAIEIANQTSYGLGAGVWCSDTEIAIETAQQINAGNVWVNGFGIVHPSVPFGGFGDSGVGRDLGPHKIDFYTEEKTIWLGLKGRSI